MKTLHTLSRTSGQYQSSAPIVEEEVSEDGLAVTEEEYWDRYYDNTDFNYEWNNGYLEEKPMTDFKGYLSYQWLQMIITQFLAVYPIAKAIGLEFGFRLVLPRKTSIRKPDMAIVLNDNPVMLHLDDCSYKGTFDLCVESLSYSRKKEILRDTVEKKKEYEGGGVREYYILDARGKETAFYQIGQKGKYKKIKPLDKEIVRSEVLPGFQFRIPDLYHQPSLEKMAEDEIYQGYILPFYQKARQGAEFEKQRAEKAEQNAEQEKRRAKSERQRAEKAEQKAEYEKQRADTLARRLRELGAEV